MSATSTVRQCVVPILDYEEPKKVPHHAVPDILVRSRAHLALKVYDFPGEIDMQRTVLESVRQENRLRLRKSSKKDLGVRHGMYV